MKMFRAIIIVSCFCIGYKGYGQERWLLGVGLTYCSYVDNPGVNINVTYCLYRNLFVGPDFSALLTREREENGTVSKRKELEFNFNAHQLFDLGEGLGIYPLIGVHASKVTNHTEDKEPLSMWVLGLNMGGGVEMKIKSIRLFLESKYVFGFPKFDVTGGVIFTL